MFLLADPSHLPDGEAGEGVKDREKKVLPSDPKETSLTAKTEKDSSSPAGDLMFCLSN